MAEARVERRLAAVLAADVSGYSRLMGIDEEGTLAALKAYRREIVDPKIAEHRGRIVKTTGDGVLVEFASTVDAVRCAIDIQRAMPARSADMPPEKKIEFRIGINVGDIIVDGEDIFGDGVNVAARLEKLARLRALEDAIDVRRGAPIRIELVNSVGQQAAEFSEDSARIDGRKAVASCQRCDLCTMDVRERIRHHH
jgi:class 3 adenylate cyclase